jgi:EAL domain-containing protein (putative c-di-GMP-specific phosphodiesterase class I)
LARLIRDDGEIIPAEVFIDAVEQSGVITNLDQYMIQAVANSIINVVGKSNTYPLVFINLSPASIQHCDILQYASTICKQQGIPPQSIVFEMTEREVISDLTSMKYFLGELRDRGFAFALDDFGSGYNSFQYLRELHFEYIKIDGEFVRNMLHNKVDCAVVESIYSLCNQLQMKTIAESVESNEILTRLQQVGITYCQGFHTGPPAQEFVVNEPNR